MNPIKGSARGREDEVIAGGVESLTVLWPIWSLAVMMMMMTVNRNKCIVKMLLRCPNSLQMPEFQPGYSITVDVIRKKECDAMRGRSDAQSKV